MMVELRQRLATSETFQMLHQEAAEGALAAASAAIAARNELLQEHIHSSPMSTTNTVQQLAQVSHDLEVATQLNQALQQAQEAQQ